HHVGPEPRAILAHAPALVLEAALAGGQFQLGLRPAGAHRLLRVEAREVVADDLVRAVALDALGAGVPAHHDALGIEGEDGVVLDPVHQQAEQVRPRLHGRRHALHRIAAIVHAHGPPAGPGFAGPPAMPVETIYEEPTGRRGNAQ